MTYYILKQTPNGVKTVLADGMDIDNAIDFIRDIEQRMDADDDWIFSPESGRARYYEGGDRIDLTIISND